MNLLECDNCHLMYDPTGCRWRCPYCGYKGNCCEGAPLPPRKENRAAET